MQENKKIDALTGARFFAIMVIVCSHFEFLGNYSIGKMYFSYFHNPAMGVDFFFMLSGFGMMLSSMKMNARGDERINGIRELVVYAIRHVRKIYPVYVAMLLIGIPYYILDCVIDRQEALMPVIIKSIIHFSYSLTLLQSATGMVRCSHALNGVCWFLSTLFCIYLVSPIVMKYLKRTIHTQRDAIKALLIAVFCSYVSAILFKLIDAHTIFDDLVYGSPYRRVFYVICGMIVAKLYSLCDLSKGSVLLEYVTVVLSMVWFFARNTIASRIGTLVYIVDMLLCAGVLYALSRGKGRISRAFAGKTMVYLGNISVYIFITHYLIRMYVDFVVRYFKLESAFAAVMEIAIILCLTFLVSVLIDRRNRLKTGK